MRQKNLRKADSESDLEFLLDSSSKLKETLSDFDGEMSKGFTDFGDFEEMIDESKISRVDLTSFRKKNWREMKSQKKHLGKDIEIDFEDDSSDSSEEGEKGKKESGQEREINRGEPKMVLEEEVEEHSDEEKKVDEEEQVEKIEEKGKEKESEENAKKVSEIVLGDLGTCLEENKEAVVKRGKVEEEKLNISEEELSKFMDIKSLIELVKSLDSPPVQQVKHLFANTGQYSNEGVVIFELFTLVYLDEQIGMPIVRNDTLELLNELKNLVDVWIFTSSIREFAEPIVNMLDPEEGIFSYVFYQDSCVCLDEDNDIYVKDLRIFKDRNLENILLVDDNLVCSAFQLDNGILIPSYCGEETDENLLAIYLYIANYDVENKSLVQCNREQFKTKFIIDFFF